MFYVKKGSYEEYQMVGRCLRQKGALTLNTIYTGRFYVKKGLKRALREGFTSKRALYDKYGVLRRILYILCGFYVKKGSYDEYHMAGRCYVGKGVLRPILWEKRGTW